MITPENYYLEYKKISTLFSEKFSVIFSIMFTIPLLIIIYNKDKNGFYVLSIILYLLFMCIVTYIFGNLIKRKKLKKLKALTNDDSINKNNFHDKLNNYITENLEELLLKYKINAEIYNLFYRDQLNNYCKISKNIFGDNAYITFILGTIYVSFLQAIFNMSKNFEEIIITLILIFIFSLYIILVIIYPVKLTTDSKYKEISKLIFYTETILLKQNK